MAGIVKNIREKDLQNIIDHREKTAGEMCKAYTLAQVSMIENLSRDRIRYSWKYIPVRIDSSEGRNSKRGYSVRYILVSEFEKILSKKLGYTIHITK